LEAAGLLAAGMTTDQVAARLRVTLRSVRRWRAALACGDQAALASRGSGGSVCRLGAAHLEALGQALDAGPAARGWVQDQRWTLPRVAKMIWELFRVRYTPRGACYLPRRRRLTARTMIATTIAPSA
jgi:putative transposase